MKLKRIISGVVLFLILAVILIFGNSLAVSLSISIVAMLSINEYFNCLKCKGKTDRWIGFIFAALIAFIQYLPKEVLILAIPVAILLLFIKVIISKMNTNFEDVAFSTFGIVYIVGFISFFLKIFSLEHGRFLIWYLAIAAWATDTFAYIIGCKFGKHKLTPISPKKSVEGSLGGIIGAMLVSLIYTYCINKFAGLGLSYLKFEVMTIVLSILAQIGDLAASTIKRYVDIKDFSNLIPGHGGMLDRIDSLLFILPFAYVFLTLI